MLQHAIILVFLYTHLFPFPLFMVASNVFLLSADPLLFFISSFHISTVYNQAVRLILSCQSTWAAYPWLQRPGYGKCGGREHQCGAFELFASPAVAGGDSKAQLHLQFTHIILCLRTINTAAFRPLVLLGTQK